MINKNETIEIPQYIWEYAKDSAVREKASKDLELFLSNTARNIGISPHIISARAKSFESFYEKAKKLGEDGKTPKYADPQSEIHDCLAARVILYTESDKKNLSEELSKSLNIIEGPFNPGDQKNNGYDSIHIIAKSVCEDEELEETSPKRYPDLFTYFNKYPAIEIQLRSVASHAWAEYEHDVRYKSSAYIDLSKIDKRKIDQLFIEAGGLRRYIDETFDKIQQILNSSSTSEQIDDNLHEEPIDELISDSPNEQLTIDSLSLFSKTEYNESLSPDLHVIQSIFSQLNELDIKTPDDLRRTLSNIDSSMTGRYLDYSNDVTSSRRLDDDLLAALGEKYIAAEKNQERQRVLNLRHQKIQGKISIYQVSVNGEKITTMTPATKALRSIVNNLAQNEKIPNKELRISDVVEFDTSEFSNNARPIAIKSPNGPIYIRTNLNRHWSESSMHELSVIARNYEIDIKVTKSGDQIIPSEKYS